MKILVQSLGEGGSSENQPPGRALKVHRCVGEHQRLAAARAAGDGTTQDEGLERQARSDLEGVLLRG